MNAATVRTDLDPLELASGVPLGTDPDASPLPPAGTTPVRAVEDAVLPALVRPPCIVSFSGGRDSSAVLAVAARVARREGLPLPVPASARFPGTVHTEESAWQELVVGHLGLEDWVRLDFGDELDLLGPVSTRLLRRHGVVWPPNTYFHQPFVELARGGSLLTGVDGDGLFGGWRWRRAADVVAGRAPRTVANLARVAYAASPVAVRALGARRGPPLTLGWLRPAALASVERAWRREGAGEPFPWPRRIRWYARRRMLRLTLRNLDLLAADAGAVAVSPLADPRFLAALAGSGGRWGFGDRTAAMRAVFAGLLPDAVLARRSKAIMNEPFWNRHTAEFVAGWGGAGVDMSLVDIDGLRREWSSESPDAKSSALLQAAWLATCDPR